LKSKLKGQKYRRLLHSRFGYSTVFAIEPDFYYIETDRECNGGAWRQRRRSGM
jgi:hypothetical protein